MSALEDLRSIHFSSSTFWAAGWMRCSTPTFGLSTHSTEAANVNDEALLSIARHWTWADCVREQFKVALTGSVPDDLWSFCKRPEVGYMFIWYALLFAVCEGLKEQRVKIPNAQAEIDGLYQMLKRCRNAVAHVQPRYWSQKLLDFVVLPKNATAVHTVHNATGEWIRDELLRRKLTLPQDFK
jgi:hypothetical protein